MDFQWNKIYFLRLNIDPHKLKIDEEVKIWNKSYFFSFRENKPFFK